MVMAVKQQMLSCRSPLEVLLVTLNHLDALRGYATHPQTAALVEASLNLFRQVRNNDSERSRMRRQKRMGCNSRITQALRFKLSCLY